MDKSDIKTFLAKRKQMDKYIKYEKLNWVIFTLHYNFLPEG
jgi:hypothetical protein